MPSGFRMKGAAAMAAKLKAEAAAHQVRLARGLNIEAEIEVTEMKRRCPVDVTPPMPHPGNLRNSIHVEETQIVGNTFRAVWATGAQAPYAIFVHENPDAFHKVGEWRFMASVIDESRAHMAARIARHIDFGRGKGKRR